TRILFDAPWTKGKGKSVQRRWLAAILSPILQPKYAMGMAMTILSISMLARFVAPIRQPQLADMQPAKVWAGLEDRAVRAWARSVKYYENLKFVYQIQIMLRDWQQQDEDRNPEAGRKAAPAKTDDRKLPLDSPNPAPGATPGEAPRSNP